MTFATKAMLMRSQNLFYYYFNYYFKYGTCIFAKLRLLFFSLWAFRTVAFVFVLDNRLQAIEKKKTNKQFSFGHCDYSFRFSFYGETMGVYSVQGDKFR